MKMLKKFQSSILFRSRENTFLPKTFHTDISNYRVTSLLKKALIASMKRYQAVTDIFLEGHAASFMEKIFKKLKKNKDDNIHKIKQRN